MFQRKQFNLHVGRYNHRLCSVSIGSGLTCSFMSRYMLPLETIYANDNPSADLFYNQCK